MYQAPMIPTLAAPSSRPIRAADSASCALRRIGLTGTAVGCLLAWWAPAAGSAQRTPANQFALDAEVVGGSLSYAWGGRDGTYWGVAAGLGGSLLNRMLVAGAHFAHEDGPSYEPRDGYGDKDLYELIHLGFFRRWTPPGRWSWDVGVRGSAMVHFDTSDDDPGFPLFVGGYGNVMWGNRSVKVGPRLLVGVFSEAGSATEFGVYLAPLTGRVAVGW